MKLLVVTSFAVFSFCFISQAKEADIPAPVKIEQAQKLIADGAQLVDVRTKEEWNEGHLKEAQLITVTDDGFLAKAKKALDSEKPVVVYCRSGKRSAKATAILREAGFTVHDLKGGFNAWKSAEMPVVKP